MRRNLLISLRFLPLVALVAACRCAPAAPPAGAGHDGHPRLDCPLPPLALAAVGDGVAEVDEFALVLAAFDRAYDDGRFDVALACAQEAGRLAPDAPAAHHDRAVALEALGDRPAAASAWQRTLALDPDDSESLLGAARFLFADGTDDALETAALYARRGRERAAEAALGAELAGVESAALNDLGRGAEALAAAESGLALEAEQPEALVERAVALFELLRFDEARPALEAARRRTPDSARVLWFLGLVREREGARDAERLFEEASRLDPEAYPPALPVAPDAFRALVDAEVSRLPDAQRARLTGVTLEVQEFPSLDDLASGEPVLSPTIVGLYRPDEAPGRATIVLYRRNLLRLAHTPGELATEVRRTLLHELGHHDGEDDAALRDRGL